MLNPDELQVEHDQSITGEERQRILAQIDEILATSRLKVTPATFEFTPRRRGVMLPLVVNGAAVLIIAAGVILALALSRRTESSLVAAPVAILSAEGKMVEALKEESQQALAGKDREISDIRGKLSGMEAERGRIRDEADASVRQKEQELQAAMTGSLDEERRRMEASGLSAAAVAARIDALQAENAARQQAQLADFRRQADAERASREKALAAMEAGYQQNLAQAQAQRAQLQSDAARRQTELEAGYKQKQLALEKDTAAAQSELSALRANQANEQLALDQLLSWYQKVREQIQAGRPEAARAVLADFRRYLDDPAVASLPAVSRRRPVDLFLIGSLDDLARGQAEQASAADNLSALTASAGLVAAVAATVQQADALYRDKAYDRARELYLSALARIPAVRTGYERLTQIESILADRNKKTLADLMAAGNAAYRAGDYPAAAASYAKAVEGMQDDRAAADNLVSQLTDIGARQKAAEDAALITGLQEESAARARRLAAIDSLRATLQSASVAAAATPNSQDTLVSLLETKLLVQQTLLRPEVVRDHPDLYERLNTYLDALSAQNRSEARLQTLREIDAMLQGLGATGESSLALAGGSPAAASVPRVSSADEQSLLLSILSRLRGQLQ